MPAASFDQLPKSGFGDERSVEWGELRIDVAKPPPGDLAPLLKGLPDDRCQCPHWGYLISGKIVVRYADHEETIEAGEAYYAAPGHTPVLAAGTEVIEFSPTAQLQATMEVVGRNAAAALGSR